MNPSTVYMCSVCEREHTDYYEAEECCQPEVWTLYRCEVCGETHEDESDARECCANSDTVPGEIGTGDHRNYPLSAFIQNDIVHYVDSFICANHYVR